MPTTSGTEYFRPIRQRLPKHTEASVDYRLPGAFSLGAEYDRYGELGFARVTSRYHWGDWLNVGLGYDLKAKAPRFTVQSTYVNFELSADSTDVKAAKFLNASLGLNAAF